MTCPSLPPVLNPIESNIHVFYQLLSLYSYLDIFVFQIRELEPLLCQAGHTSRVVWTSSSNARRSAFNIEDMQHRNGTEPYSSSKYASDMLSLALNGHKNSQVCLSHTLHTLQAQKLHVSS